MDKKKQNLKKLISGKKQTKSTTNWKDWFIQVLIKIVPKK